MSSEPIRDPRTDHLLTPQNSALVVIDYQPFQCEVVTSMDRDLLVRNIVSVARTARTFGLPIVLSTVGVAANGREPTIPALKEVLADSSEIDRSSINAWEDTEFRQAVAATGRKKLIMTALWTEMCLALPSRRSTRSERATRCTRWLTPWRGRPPRRTGPVWSASCKPAGSRSAGWAWRGSCSGTGPGGTRWPTSLTSSSPRACLRASRPAGGARAKLASGNTIRFKSVFNIPASPIRGCSAVG
jgi:Isochorismatase family